MFLFISQFYDIKEHELVSDRPNRRSACYPNSLYCRWLHKANRLNVPDAGEVLLCWELITDTVDTETSQNSTLTNPEEHVGSSRTHCRSQRNHCVSTVHVEVSSIYIFCTGNFPDSWSALTEKNILDQWKVRPVASLFFPWQRFQSQPDSLNQFLPYSQENKL